MGGGREPHSAVPVPAWLDELARREPHGYRLASARPGGTLDLTFRKGERDFTVWVAPRASADAFFAQTDRLRFGYRGDPPDPLGFALLLEIRDVASVREGEIEASLHPPASDPSPRAPGLVVRDGRVELRVTLRCNEHCAFCNTDPLSENVLPSGTDVSAAIEQAARAGAHTVTFTGGEPTLLKDLPTWVVAARRLGLRAWVQTNGLGLSRPGFRERFVEADGRLLGPDFLISFHTTRAARVRSITGGRMTLARKIAAVRAAQEFGGRVVLSFVAHDANLDEVEGLPEFVARTFGTGVPILLSVVAPTGRLRAEPSRLPRVADVVPHLVGAIDAAARCGVRLLIPETCGVPMCVLGPHRRSLVAFYRTKPVDTLPPDRVKTPRCANCVANPTCIGIWRETADRHGTD